METTFNRVEAELDKWQQREQRFVKLFPNAMSSNRLFQQEKLDHYERVIAKYRHTGIDTEKFTLKLLEQERRQLERKLHPNLMIRLLRQLLIVPLKERLIEKRFEKESVQNTQALFDKVNATGFKDLSAQLLSKINQGLDSFSIPVSYYVNSNEKLEHDLSFSKNLSGQYDFLGYSATLTSESSPNDKRTHFFSAQKDCYINHNEAYNFLSGRSIEKNGKWLQLDLNNKDLKGNYRVREFHPEYGYNLAEQLSKIPLEKADIETIQHQLRQGDLVTINIDTGKGLQTVNIEANPRFKDINIYNDRLKKTRLEDLIENKQDKALVVPIVKTPEPNTRKVKSVGKSVY